MILKSFWKNKLKKNIAIREVERMKIVQNHPIYIANPLEAITTHLQSMIDIRNSNNNVLSNVIKKNKKQKILKK